ncbi:MAG: 16S rRNA (guanine(966)-N(2))-methyltransferase RsmD [Gemmatimonadetes bacterium]|nr:16S rRNA (guanine(966)-N(2))-methyltransferase RsmD [Gemmatimonadota bacterium]
MRVIAGEWRGRPLVAPAGRSTRPTTDRAREAWMSIIHPGLVGARVLDLFAGSGALGLEALSRGAAEATFVEDDPRALTALRKNVAALGAADRVTIVRADAVRFVKSLDAGAFDIAFADPPYEKGLATAVAERWLDAPFAHILGVEHSPREPLPQGADSRRYGDTAITFYRD